MSESGPEIIPGLKRSQLYYAQAVQPILQTAFLHLPHSPGLIGYGSDMFGIDTPLSRDHMWGPRLVLFLPEQNFISLRAQVDATLRKLACLYQP